MYSVLFLLLPDISNIFVKKTVAKSAVGNCYIDFDDLNTLICQYIIFNILLIIHVVEASMWANNDKLFLIRIFEKALIIMFIFMWNGNKRLSSKYRHFFIEKCPEMEIGITL